MNKRLFSPKMRETLLFVEERDNTIIASNPNPKKNRKPEEDETLATTEEGDPKVEKETTDKPPPPKVRSQGSTRKVAPVTTTGSFVVVEKLLSNGDIYKGCLTAGNVPHGSGKYLWSDGCMYEGEWKRGKASGKGRFLWPSGATYEGDFRSGRMEGFGTFIGSDGNTYRGSWSGGRKHGYGQKCYANGDSYEGWWRRNLQDGEGRYVWMNGNQYVGEWKNGVMSGKGVLICSDGNRYDGHWDHHGVPKGDRVFRLVDEDCHVGCWNRDPSIRHHQLKGTSFRDPEKEMQEGLVLGDDGDFPVAKKRSSVEADRIFPRICIWESDGEDGDITCDIVDNGEASMFYRKGSDCDRFEQFRRSPRCLSGSEVKKPGEMISKGHRNYDLMLNLQLGIRCSVQKHASILRDLKPSDFDPKEKFWTRFPPEGSKKTPPHQSAEFRWKDYCPLVFRHLRDLFQVDPDDYTLAICGNALRELSSPGKSGSFFYLTQDDRFMIKTVKKSDVKVLNRMLSSYYQHVSRYDNSLVTKFFGVHCVKPVGGQKTRFIVMGNLFCSEYRIHSRFDLKGSSHGRATDKPEDEIDENTTLKDLDLNFVFRLQRNWFKDLIRQIDLDCEFLEAERVMDYSLLVGLHFRNNDTSDRMGLSQFLLRTGKQDTYPNEKLMHSCGFLEAELQDMDQVMSGWKPLIRLGANMPARAERIARKSDFDQFAPACVSSLIPSCGGEIYEVILYFGIIDILQDYDISKKLEHVYKSIQANPTSISAVDPKLYSKRFRDFIRRIFLEDG